jgi:ABC-type sugar transport system permease subunit
MPELIRAGPGRRLRDVDWAAYLYLAPAGVLLAVFSLWPIALGAWISLWRWGVEPQRFVGLGNYVRIFTQDVVAQDFRGLPTLGPIGQSFIVTLYYVIGTVPFSIILAFLVASLLFHLPVLRDVLRTIYFLPYITSVVAASMVFFWIFNPQVGVANDVLHALGLPTQTWLQDPTPVGTRFLTWIGIHGAARVPDPLMGPSVALTVVILFSVWNSLGFDVVIYLSALSAISPELDQAAQVDGAGAWQRIRHVTLPLVSPTTLFLLVTSTIRSFQAFTPIFALTEGGSGGTGLGEAGAPLGTTRVLTVTIFTNFYERPNSVGYASAVAMVLLVCILILTAVQLRVVGRRAFYAN